MRIIAGRWRGHRLRAPKGRNVRPTTDRVREAWMSALGGDVHDARVLDLFAGSGALGLEALSRGAARVVFVERARGALQALRANVEHLGVKAEVDIVAADVFQVAGSLGEGNFDVALADPPYGTGDASRLVELFRKQRFAQELWVEHPWRDALPVGPADRTRRYGDTALTTVTLEP